MTYDERQCANCDDGFTPKRYNQRFCTPKCQKAFDGRKLGDGYAAITLLTAWHETRHAPSGSDDAALCSMARRELTQLASMVIARNKLAGRPRSADYYADLAKDGGMVIDRVRRERG